MADVARSQTENSRESADHYLAQRSGLPLSTHSVNWLRREANEGLNICNVAGPQIAYKLNSVFLDCENSFGVRNMDDHSVINDNSSLEEFLQITIGGSNDARSRQAKEALRSERFKSIEDMRSRIKNVGDLVRMGVPLPQAKLIWKAIHESHKKNLGEKITAPCTTVLHPEKELQPLIGMKMHASLYEW
jgi:hypothetical protein